MGPAGRVGAGVEGVIVGLASSTGDAAVESAGEWRDEGSVDVFGGAGGKRSGSRTLARIANSFLSVKER